MGLHAFSKSHTVRFMLFAFLMIFKWLVAKYSVMEWRKSKNLTCRVHRQRENSSKKQCQVRKQMLGKPFIKEEPHAWVKSRLVWGDGWARSEVRKPGRAKWWSAACQQQAHRDGLEEPNDLPAGLFWHSGADDWDLSHDTEPERQDRDGTREEL